MYVSVYVLKTMVIVYFQDMASSQRSGLGVLIEYLTLLAMVCLFVTVTGKHGTQGYDSYSPNALDIKCPYPAVTQSILTLDHDYLSVGQTLETSCS